MLNLMVGMMAICAVGVSIRWHHFWLFVCRGLEKCICDVRVYFLRWMHIFLVGVLALDGGTIQKIKSLACPLPISVNCAIGQCIDFKNHFTPASHFYMTQKCVYFYMYYVLFSTFECQYSRLPIIFILGVLHCALCTLFTIDFIMGVFQCVLCMYNIYYLAHYFPYEQKFGSQVLYRYLRVFLIINLIYANKYYSIGNTSLPNFFCWRPIYILPLLIYTSSWPSLPLHHLLILLKQCWIFSLVMC
jgi:hypothetical protein